MDKHLVSLRIKPQTLDEYAFWQRVYAHYPKDERNYIANGYCPFFEAFPSEDVGFGNFPVAVYPMGERCHHPQSPNPLPCEGQYCNCPLSIET